MQKNYEPGDTSSGACYSLKVCPHKCSFWVWLGMKMIPWKMPWNTKNVRLFVSPLVQHFWAIFQGISSIHRLIASPILPNRYGTKTNKKQNNPNAVVFVSCDTFPLNSYCDDLSGSSLFCHMFQSSCHILTPLPLDWSQGVRRGEKSSVCAAMSA